MDTYYHPHDLGKFAEMGKGNKDLWERFMGYYNAVFQASLEKGSNVEEMTEAVHVACAIRGGASLVHGVQMRNVAEKLSM